MYSLLFHYIKMVFLVLLNDDLEKSQDSSNIKFTYTFKKEQFNFNIFISILKSAIYYQYVKLTNVIKI